MRRRELGVLLRDLRTQRGWTVGQVAQRLLCSPSKVSRLETGHRGASARDIRDLCNLYGVPDKERQRLLVLATAGKQRAWWQSLDLPYSDYVGLEAEAVGIQDFGLGMVPGLLQTADYAEAVGRVAVPRQSPEVINQRVEGRIARQRILTASTPPRFEAVIDESVLHRVVGSAAIMDAQLQRLLQLSELPNLELMVLPYESGALPHAFGKFIILSFASSSLSDVVFVEGLTRGDYIDDRDEVAEYKATFQALSGLAASSDRSRAIISSVIMSYRSRQ
ncbi:MAG TPA: helix-turn-helix transcriptional regulator [Actinomycetes bacterium]|nr:helix-turn-helix transcriptional regulator [Actinomycetes bacterium]